MTIRALIPALLFCTVASVNPAMAKDGWVELPKDTIGCRTQEQLLKLIQLLQSGDNEAAKSYMAEQNSAHNCVRVTHGEVHIDDVYPTTGRAVVSCLRGRGDTVCSWVPNSEAF